PKSRKSKYTGGKIMERNRALGARFARSAAVALIGMLAAGAASAAPHVLVRGLMGKNVDAPPTDAYCRVNFGSPCYSPQEMRTSYGLNGLIGAGIVGAGQTI